MLNKRTFQPIPLSVLSALLLCTEVSAFFTYPSVQKNGKRPKSSPLCEDAVQIFGKQFPFDRPPIQSSPFIDFGMPYTDFDGTILMKKDGSRSSGKRLTDISRDQVRASFNVLASLYGDEQALGMVKALPICLAFNEDKFGPSLKAFSDVFGDDKAKAMVIRNPGLLAVTPSDAASATEQTMIFSYIIGFTRPFGRVLLPLLLFALLSPAIEAFTGIPVRSSFLEFVSGM